MINFISKIEEIGFFESLKLIQPHLVNSTIAKQAHLELSMPDDEDIKARIVNVVEKLDACQKEKLLFISPELAILEGLAARKSQHKIIIVIPCDLEPSVVERIQNNIPTGIQVSFLKEPFFPSEFIPQNSAIVACGLENGTRAMLLPRSYRIMDRYNSFMGRKIFIPCVGASVLRPYHWVEIYKEVMFNDQF